MGRARVLLLVGVVIWGWTFVATKVCLASLDPFQLLALRFVIALPVLWAIERLRGTRAPRGRRRAGLVFAASMFALHFVVQVVGLQFTTATNTGWIIAVTPLVLAAMSFVVLGERIGRRTVTGIGISTLGILVLVSSGDPAALGGPRSLGDWLVLGSAHTWALYTIATRRLSRSWEPLALTRAVLLPATGVMLVLAAWSTDWASPPRPPVEALAAVAFLGVFGTALGHWFWQVGVARVGAAGAGVFLFLEPLATTALAVPYLGEPFTAWTATGGLLVLAGVAWSQSRSRSR